MRPTRLGIVVDLAVVWLAVACAPAADTPSTPTPSADATATPPQATLPAAEAQEGTVWGPVHASRRAELVKHRALSLRDLLNLGG